MLLSKYHIDDGSTIDGQQQQHKFASNSRSGITNRNNGKTTIGLGSSSSQNTIMKQLIVLTMLLFTFKEATGLAGE